MELSKQVISLDLAKRLRELGAPQDISYFIHCKIGEFDETIWRNYLTLYDGVDMESVFAAYTVAELGELVVKGIPPHRKSSFFLKFHAPNTWEAHFDFIAGIAFTRESWAESLGALLAWLIEQGYVKFGEVS